MTSTDQPLAFDAEAFAPIAQHVLGEREAQSVRTPAAAAGDASQEVASAPSSVAVVATADDQEFEQACAIALTVIASLLKRQMSEAEAERGSVLLVRVMRKHYPDVNVGCEGALGIWAVSWYMASKPIKPTVRDSVSTADGKTKEPPRRDPDPTPAAQPDEGAGFDPARSGVNPIW